MRYAQVSTATPVGPPREGWVGGLSRFPGGERVVDLSEYLSRSEAAHALRCSGEYVAVPATSGRLPSAATPNGRIDLRPDVERPAAQRADRGRRDPLPAA